RTQGVEETCAKQLFARVVHTTGNRIALGCIYLGLHQAALGNFPAQGIFAVRGRKVRSVGVGGVGRIPVLLSLGLDSLLIGGLGLFDVRLIRLGRCVRCLRVRD